MLDNAGFLNLTSLASGHLFRFFDSVTSTPTIPICLKVCTLGGVMCFLSWQK